MKEATVAIENLNYLIDLLRSNLSFSYFLVIFFDNIRYTIICEKYFANSITNVSNGFLHAITKITMSTDKSILFSFSTKKQLVFLNFHF